ncbi:TauD/TfdA family dioxygenase [Bradyrhizobium sp. U87765 SZCCT0131]|uniref:TauD/TfdA dioxygenase family protein n=1 Tax=unclassified Bradyrhizobium TaxID=2631580 RepID=UPI001BA63A1D|nr:MULTISPECIES: TauD/TfdA family dioxygenase [unclassified Bradyrhizobium]MBR1217750.1 TauD/TfdA family dioxygenase [Bradyrhizobium sp. U87765 SZCCT0131]MBR1261304.1 TauD/TfdA family dioxygenase [Bradyrhizobium sp. U87765 SZCCT0134]MBR1303248.1 TauD/TfdA family dioxygenase [Bradyrhizobium sp. U87765 SZCCT0110]MBR1318854.1 TauD/TfdA family dioxygenase [Bradyrhizobium sp. U87765 SZCCT0109]MBR1347179.1 TauD/TfdA family dioxygenase [Bradyrhizobium sp. U87765 SZCCT0048]
MTQSSVTDLAAHIDTVQLAGRLGAEIRNVRLAGDLPDPVIRAINHSLLKHKVVFFRGQDHLDDAEQERFAQRLGALVPHPTVGAIKGTSSILELDSSRGGGRADQWHTDVTFVDAYPKFSVLRGVVIPPFGGDTVWSNTAAAYDNLPKPLQRLADELWALHSNAYDYAAVKTRASEADRKHFEEVFTGTIYETEHPVVRVHPETGERTLLLGNFVQRFIGLPKSDGQKLYDLFQSHITAPENTVRWRWQAGDVAIWDNRATQHYAVNDYGDQHRIVRRATVDGDIPVGVDGRRSTTRIKAQKPTVKAA